eukprot:1035641-Lingulodinium_polyedra.AAC.1
MERKELVNLADTCILGLVGEGGTKPTLCLVDHNLQTTGAAGPPDPSHVPNCRDKIRNRNCRPAHRLCAP